MHARERRRDGRAGALPGDRRAQEPAARDRRHVERLAPAGRREPGLAQQLRDLRARIGPAVAERRRIHARPQPAPVRHHRQQPAARRQHAPHLAQQRAGSCDISSACTSSTRSTAASVSGRSISSTSAASAGPRGRPFHHALRRRHEGKAALGLFAKQAEIGRRIADAEHALAARIGPARADAAADEAARHHARAAGRRNCAGRRRRWTWRQVARIQWLRPARDLDRNPRLHGQMLTSRHANAEIRCRC